MKNKLKSLDCDAMKRLYDFGGLICYRVTYFDTTLWRLIDLPATFSESHARKTQESYKRSGYATSLKSELIAFDGEFSL